LINNFTIITSIKDPASNTMKNYLIEDEKFEIINYDAMQDQNNYNNSKTEYKKMYSVEHPNTTLIITNQSLINIDNLDKLVSKDSMIIFLSKHASKSETPALTSHSTGNFSEIVSLGGKPIEIGNTFPSFQKHYMKKLYEKRNELPNYDLIIEATHHGPTSSINPMLFIEIGSSEIEWNNRSTASIACNSLLDTIKDIEKINNSDANIGIGIGGNHYPKKFNDLILFSDVAFGPIVSKYNLSHINEKIIKQIMIKSIEKINHIYIDENGLGKEKVKILKILEDLDSEIAYI
jgi:D-aminoacyl-tRNA deacylase